MALLSIPVVYFSKPIINYCYTPRTKTFLINTAWNIMQWCSYLEIKVISAYKKIKTYLPSTDIEPDTTITFVKDGSEILFYELSDFLLLKKLDEFSSIKYDFILYEMPICKNDMSLSDKFTKCVLRYEDYTQIVKIKFNTVNEFKFSVIQFSLKNSDTIISIDFNTIQYLVQGNIIFDQKFLKWYLHKYHNFFIRDEDEYTVTFIDHNMNYILLNENKYIIVKKNKYDIIEMSDTTSM